jgi:hypothetical protein
MTSWRSAKSDVLPERYGGNLALHPGTSIVGLEFLFVQANVVAVHTVLNPTYVAELYGTPFSDLTHVSGNICVTAGALKISTARSFTNRD